MPSRTICSTGAWNGEAAATSRKSANHARGRMLTAPPPPFVTVTSYTKPALRPGAVAPMRVELVTEAPASAPPIETVAPDWNWLPTTAIVVPPVAGPDAGVRYAALYVVDADRSCAESAAAAV